MVKWKKKAREKNIFLDSLKIGIFIILAFGAIRLGIMGGDMLVEADARIIESTDTEVLKTALNYSLPIIDMVYNSGHISVSLSNEVKNIVKGIFNFDLDSPLTILNAQSPMLYSYFYNNYRPEQVALGGNNGGINEFTVPDGVISRGGDEDLRNGDLRKDALVPEDSGDKDSNDISNEDEPEGEDGKQHEKEHENENTPKPDAVISDGKVLVQQLEGTKYKLDIDALLKEPLKINFSKSGPKMLIYHTHTTEAYIKNIGELNNKNVPARTEDVRYNVVRVGDELDKQLNELGISVIHNGTNHIEKTDVGCYARSLDTMTNIINGNPSVKLTFDIHRDGLGGDKKLRAVTKVNGKDAAKVMFVVGTDFNKSLPNPNWKENLKLAVKLQKYLEDNYPGITKPIYISKNRYNMHVTTGSLIMEVGGDGNTIDEAVESMKYVAKAINAVIK